MNNLSDIFLTVYECGMGVSRKKKKEGEAGWGYGISRGIEGIAS